MPSSDPLFVALNRASFAGDIARQLQFLAYGLMAPPEVVLGKAATMDRDEAAAFAAGVDASRLGGIALEKVGAPTPAILNSERNLANATKMAAVDGADERTERVALIAFEGQHYMMGFTLLRFGAEWKVNGQVSPVAGTNAFGIPVLVTPEAFDEILQ